MYICVCVLYSFEHLSLQRGNGFMTAAYSIRHEKKSLFRMQSTSQLYARRKRSRLITEQTMGRHTIESYCNLLGFSFIWFECASIVAKMFARRKIWKIKNNINRNTDRWYLKPLSLFARIFFDSIKVFESYDRRFFLYSRPSTRQLISIRTSIVQIIIHRASRITGLSDCTRHVEWIGKINARVPVTRRGSRSFVQLTW